MSGVGTPCDRNPESPISGGLRNRGAMKRDMDLARKILLQLEEVPYRGGAQRVALEGYSDDEVSYHVLLLREAGLVEALDFSSHDGVCWVPTRLTWEGHEFLDAARSSKLWEAAKQHLLKTFGVITLEGLKAVLRVLSGGTG